MSIQYAVLGFELTTFGKRVSSHNQSTQALDWLWPQLLTWCVSDFNKIFFFQNPSISSTLRQRKGENISEISLTVCSGLDMVNINLNHFVFADKETLEVRDAASIHSAIRNDQCDQKKIAKCL